MITSILQLSNSPTQEKTRKANLGSIESDFEDNDGKMFMVKVDYEWTPYYGLGGERSIWSFDYTVNGKANIDSVDLNNLVKDLIEEDSNCNVTFY